MTDPSRVIHRQTPRYIGNWRDSEDCAAEWMRAMGWKDAQVTASGPDGGLDVVSSGAVAQVKFKQQSTSRPALQQLVGARGHRQDQMLFFSLSDFTVDAQRYASQMGIALFLLHPEGSLEPRNEPARAISSSVAQYAKVASQPAQGSSKPAGRGRIARAWSAAGTWLKYTGLTAWDEFQHGRGAAVSERQDLLDGSTLAGRGVVIMLFGILGSVALATDSSPTATVGHRVGGAMFYASVALLGFAAFRLGNRRRSRIGR